MTASRSNTHFLGTKHRPDLCHVVVDVLDSSYRALETPQRNIHRAYGYSWFHAYWLICGKRRYSLLTLIHQHHQVKAHTFQYYVLLNTLLLFYSVIAFLFKRKSFGICSGRQFEECEVYSQIKAYGNCFLCHKYLQMKVKIKFD